MAEQSSEPQLDVTAATRHDYLADAISIADYRRGRLVAAASAAPPVAADTTTTTTTTRLPLFVQPLHSAVLFPGHRLPIVVPRSLLDRPGPIVVVIVHASALSVRYFAAAPAPAPGPGPAPSSSSRRSERAAAAAWFVGCTAEVTHVEAAGATSARLPWAADDPSSPPTTAVAVVTGRQRALVRVCAASLGGLGFPELADVSVPLDGEDSAACGATPAAAARGARGPPRPFLSGHAAWPSWATRPFDAPLLARAARARVAAVLPAAAGFSGAPAELGYWFAHNMPLPAADQQRLLECHSSVMRLRALLLLLDARSAQAGTGAESASGGGAGARLEGGAVGGDGGGGGGAASQAGRQPHGAQPLQPDPPTASAPAAAAAAAAVPPRLLLGCGRCGAPVADAARALRCTEEGVSAAFINAHGFVHDVLAVRSLLGGEREGEEEVEEERGDDGGGGADTPRAAAAVRYVGAPETEHSWFPGFSWQICCCARCRNHLGWRFRRVEAEEEREDGGSGGRRRQRRGGGGGGAGGGARAPAAQGPRVFWGLARGSVIPVSEDAQREEAAAGAFEGFDEEQEGSEVEEEDDAEESASGGSGGEQGGGRESG